MTTLANVSKYFLSNPHSNSAITDLCFLRLLTTHANKRALAKPRVKIKESFWQKVLLFTRARQPKTGMQWILARFRWYSWVVARSSSSYISLRPNPAVLMKEMVCVVLILLYATNVYMLCRYIRLHGVMKKQIYQMLDSLTPFFQGYIFISKNEIVFLTVFNQNICAFPR